MACNNCMIGQSSVDAVKQGYLVAHLPCLYNADHRSGTCPMSVHIAHLISSNPGSLLRLALPHFTPM